MKANASQKSTRELLGERVRLMRALRGWSQEFLAGMCELDHSYIGSVERVERNVSIDNIEKIANALSVPISAFFIGELWDLLGGEGLRTSNEFRCQKP